MKQENKVVDVCLTQWLRFELKNLLAIDKQGGWCAFNPMTKIWT
jgi:hypothetical protein